MIPIKDSPKTRRFPIVNIALIFFNIAIFINKISAPIDQLQGYYLRFGAVPREITLLLTGANVDSTKVILSLFTSIFLHGGWLHLGGNMLYLWIFGDNIEDRIGHVKYLFFYLITGIVASLIQTLADPMSPIPIIGASGAVAGILGAYLVSCPRARVLALIPFFYFITLAEFPAVVFLLFWFVLQIISGVATLGTTGVAVAWWAHIGGFVSGMLLINLFGKKVNCE
jgi:membrane associated rhomboid family serine protease